MRCWGDGASSNRATACATSTWWASDIRLAGGLAEVRGRRLRSEAAVQDHTAHRRGQERAVGWPSMASLLLALVTREHQVKGRGTCDHGGSPQGSHGVTVVLARRAA